MKKLGLAMFLLVLFSLTAQAQERPSWLDQDKAAWKEANGYVYAVGLNSGYTKDPSEKDLLEHHQKAIESSLAKMKDLLGVDSVNGFQVISTWYDATTIYFLGACPKALNLPKPKVITMIPQPSAEKPSGQEKSDANLFDLWSPESPGLKEGNTTLEDALAATSIETVSTSKKYWERHQPLPVHPGIEDYIINTFSDGKYLYASGNGEILQEGPLAHQRSAAETLARGAARKSLAFAINALLTNLKGPGNYKQSIEEIVGLNSKVLGEDLKAHWEGNTAYVLLRVPLTSIEGIK